MATIRLLPIEEFEITAHSARVPVPFLVQGTHDVDEVVELVMAATAAVYGRVARDAIRPRHEGGGVWKGHAHYSTIDLQQALTGDGGTGEGAPPPAAPGPTEALTAANGGAALSFSALGETLHITQSRRTRSRYAPNDPIDGGTNLVIDGSAPAVVTPDGHAVVAADVGRTVVVTGGTGFTVGAYEITAQDGTAWTLDAAAGATGATGGVWDLCTAANMKQAINVTRDGVGGCDIGGQGGLDFQLDVQRAGVTLQYLLTIFSLRNTVNYGAPFWGFPPGSIRYVGAVGKFAQGERWNISHRLAFNANETNLAIGNSITIPDKRGWDYLWVGYRDEDAADGVFPLPKAAYVEIVYPEGDLSKLEIG